MHAVESTQGHSRRAPSRAACAKRDYGGARSDYRVAAGYSRNIDRRGAALSQHYRTNGVNVELGTDGCGFL